MEALSEDHFINRELVEETCLQLQREFDRMGFDLMMEGSIPQHYQAVFDLVFPLANKLLSGPPSRLSGLLYAIDISPRKMKTHFDTRMDWTQAEALTDLLIRKAMEKVVWRKVMSGKDGNTPFLH